MPQLEYVSDRDIKAKETLIRRITKLSLEFGDFTLKSGEKSHYYIDLRNTVMDATGLWAISRIIAGIVTANPVDVIGGVELGAVPIVSGVLSTHLIPEDINGFIVRKEPKEHGTKKLIEGPVKSGQSAIIIEDVITSGGSTIAAIKAAREFGLDVKGVVAVMDRLQGGHAAIEEYCPITTLLTINDLDVREPFRQNPGPTLTMTMTASQILDRGYWDAFCKLRGINEWAINEGLMDGDEEFSFTLAECKQLGIEISI